ncbi:MAG: hypothetical protein JWP81_1811 [Ferruginibacter sp.]|nr:hypothetical protein [Ferruginibacter sp.]
MTEKTKIALSAKELELVCDKEWILTKHSIIEKVYRLFGELSVAMQEQVAKNAAFLPVEALEPNPKISRGESYKDLPYVMLDYPRHFTKDSTVAIRTFFWWGNEFSIHLHLSGNQLKKALPALKQGFTSFQKNDYWVCINENPWQHHFETDNYLPLKNYTANDFEKLLQEKPFIKIAKRISLQHWDTAPEFLRIHFIEMLVLMQTNFPVGERDLSPGIPITGFDL